MKAEFQNNKKDQQFNSQNNFLSQIHSVNNNNHPKSSQFLQQTKIFASENYQNYSNSQTLINNISTSFISTEIKINNNSNDNKTIVKQCYEKLNIEEEECEQILQSVFDKKNHINLTDKKKIYENSSLQQIIHDNNIQPQFDSDNNESISSIFNRIQENNLAQKYNNSENEQQQCQQQQQDTKDNLNSYSFGFKQFQINQQQNGVHNNDYNNIGFKTGKGKQLKPDDKFIKNFQILSQFEDEDDLQPQQQIIQNLDYQDQFKINQEQIDQNDFNIGFKTGKGKYLKPDDKLIQKYQKLDLFDQEEELQAIIEENPQKINHKQNEKDDDRNKGFQTGIGKQLKPNEKFIKKYLKFEEFDSEEQFQQQQELNQNIIQEETYPINQKLKDDDNNIGFITGKGKNLKPDSKLLKKYQDFEEFETSERNPLSPKDSMVFAESDMNNINQLQNKNLKKIETKTNDFIGFQNSNGDDQKNIFDGFSSDQGGFLTGNNNKLKVKVDKKKLKSFLQNLELSDQDDQEDQQGEEEEKKVGKKVDIKFQDSGFKLLGKIINKDEENQQNNHKNMNDSNDNNQFKGHKNQIFNKQVGFKVNQQLNLFKTSNVFDKQTKQEIQINKNDTFKNNFNQNNSDNDSNYEQQIEMNYEQDQAEIEDELENIFKKNTFKNPNPVIKNENNKIFQYGNKYNQPELSKQNFINSKKLNNFNKQSVSSKQFNSNKTTPQSTLSINPQEHNQQPRPKNQLFSNFQKKKDSENQNLSKKLQQLPGETFEFTQTNYQSQKQQQMYEEDQDSDMFGSPSTKLQIIYEAQSEQKNKFQSPCEGKNYRNNLQNKFSPSDSKINNYSRNQIKISYQTIRDHLKTNVLSENSKKNTILTLEANFQDNPLIQMKLQIKNKIRCLSFNLKGLYDFKSNQLKPKNQPIKKNSLLLKKQQSQQIQQQQKPEKRQIQDILDARKHQLDCNCIYNYLSQNSSQPPEVSDYQIQKLNCFCKNQQIKVSHEDFYELLLQKDDQVNLSWVEMMYSQIIWKLYSFQQTFQDLCPINKKLTIENVFYELGYRHFRQNIKAEIPVIKKILNNDEFLHKHLILLVNRLWHEPEQKQYIIELSDGWYPIFVVISCPDSNNQNSNTNKKYYIHNQQLLCQLIQQKKITPGLKLHCQFLKKYPLGNVCKSSKIGYNLQETQIVDIDFNGISRAHNWEKLGKQQKPYFIKCLKSIRPNGGQISMIDVFVIKKYPLLSSYQKNSKRYSVIAEEKQEEEEQYCENQGAQQQHERQKISYSFKILVQDALLYYDQTLSESENQPYCIVDITHNVSADLYDEIKEGGRIRLFCLKGVSFDQVHRYCLKTNKKIERILYLETQSQSKITFMKDFIKQKEEIQKIQTFGSELADSYRFTIEDIDLQSEVKQMCFDQLKLDIDVIMYMVKLENRQIFGITSNLYAICLDIHDQMFFGKKLEKLENKIGKTIIIRNGRIKNFGVNNIQGQDIQTLRISTQETSEIKLKSDNNKNQQQFINEIKYLEENSDKFNLIKLGIQQ